MKKQRKRSSHEPAPRSRDRLQPTFQLSVHILKMSANGEPTSGLSLCVSLSPFSFVMGHLSLLRSVDKTLLPSGKAMAGVAACSRHWEERV